MLALPAPAAARRARGVCMRATRASNSSRNASSGASVPERRCSRSASRNNTQRSSPRPWRVTRIFWPRRTASRVWPKCFLKSVALMSVKSSVSRLAGWFMILASRMGKLIIARIERFARIGQKTGRVGTSFSGFEWQCCRWLFRGLANLVGTIGDYFRGAFVHFDVAGDADFFSLPGFRRWGEAAEIALPDNDREGLVGIVVAQVNEGGLSLVVGVVVNIGDGPAGAAIASDARAGFNGAVAVMEVSLG